VRKILIMLDKGVEDVEFLYPYYRFQEEGYEVDVVASKANETYMGKYGVPMTSNLSPDKAKIEDYDGLIIPGGRAPDYMRTNKGLVNIVKEAFSKGRSLQLSVMVPRCLLKRMCCKGRGSRVGNQ
jgi:protease I